MNSAYSTEDIDLLRDVAVNTGSRPGTIVEVVVNGCAYACCGRGWRRKDGYEQTYRGYIDNFHEPIAGPASLRARWEDSEAPVGQGSFMLYSAGIGTLGYVIASRWDEVLDVQLVDA